MPKGSKRKIFVKSRDIDTETNRNGDDSSNLEKLLNKNNSRYETNFSSETTVGKTNLSRFPFLANTLTPINVNPLEKKPCLNNNEHDTMNEASSAAGYPTSSKVRTKFPSLLEAVKEDNPKEKSATIDQSYVLKAPSMDNGDEKQLLLSGNTCHKRAARTRGGQGTSHRTNLNGHHGSFALYSRHLAKDIHQRKT